MKNWLFLKEDNITPGTKHMQQQKRIVQMLAKSTQPLTIDEIRKELSISTPTGIKLINALIDGGVVKSEGKKETANGRRPSLYSLKQTELYVISLEILLNKLTVSLVDMNLNILQMRRSMDFVLANTEESLQEVVSFTRETIEEFGVEHEQLLGLGVAITGRINPRTGSSSSFFSWLKPSLKRYLSQEFDLPVKVNNDTRCLGLAEKKIGLARDYRNAIVINLSQGLGTSLIVENRIVNGGNGFAGEFGHMQFGDNNKICICGKRGCLGNEVSGYALSEKFREGIENGELSLLTDEIPLSKIRHTHILNAALGGDSFSITLLQNMGLKLGRALGNIINLLNPEVIIIGGDFASAESFLGDSLKSGIANSALVNPLKNCEIKYSELGEHGTLKGAGSIVFSHFELI